MKTLTVKMPYHLIIALERLVEEGRYVSVSEAVRYAVRDLIERELMSNV